MNKRNFRLIFAQGQRGQDFLVQPRDLFCNHNLTASRYPVACKCLIVLSTLHTQPSSSSPPLHLHTGGKPYRAKTRTQNMKIYTESLSDKTQVVVFHFKNILTIRESFCCSCHQATPPAHVSLFLATM